MVGSLFECKLSVSSPIYSLPFLGHVSTIPGLLCVKRLLMPHVVGPLPKRWPPICLPEFAPLGNSLSASLTSRAPLFRAKYTNGVVPLAVWPNLVSPWLPPGPGAWLAEPGPGRQHGGGGYTAIHAPIL